MHYLYVLKAQHEEASFYIGCSSDLKNRLKAHQLGQVNSPKGKVWQLVYYEAYLTFSAARKREYCLKHNGKARRQLIERIKESMSNHE